MTVDEARAILLELDGASEGAHHGHPDFRVGKKIFATLWPAKGSSVLRLPSPLAEGVEAESPETYRVVSRSGGMGWVSVSLPAAEAESFRSLAQIAHRQVQTASAGG